MTTSNHRIMAAATRYLATQVWGNDAFVADPFFKDASGSVFTKDDPTGENYVRKMIHAALGDAPGEYASRPYGAQNILPLLTVADCASDPAIRAAAREAYGHCLAQLAPAWLGGHLATYSLRSYPDVLTQQPWGLGKTLWLYFGGVRPADPGRGYHIIAAVSPFRVPPEIEAAGTDRSKPYVHRALVSQWALSHYVNRSYALFSRSPKTRKPWMNGQVYPSGVMWDEPDPSKTSFLWITNPAADTSDDPKLGPGGIHTHGASRFGREVQFQDALLAVFDVDEKHPFPHVLGYIPGGWLALGNDSPASGRIFLCYGSVLVAISASQPFDWNPASGVRSPASPPNPGDSEFRVMSRKAAVALETAHPDDFPGTTPGEKLSSFRKAIEARPRLGFDPATSRATYTDRNGNVLEATFSGEDRINRHIVDYSRWPLLENPWGSPKKQDAK
jgi:hypothetical protein